MMPKHNISEAADKMWPFSRNINTLILCSLHIVLIFGHCLCGEVEMSWLQHSPGGSEQVGLSCSWTLPSNKRLLLDTTAEAERSQTPTHQCNSTFRAALKLSFSPFIAAKVWSFVKKNGNARHFFEITWKLTFRSAGKRLIMQKKNLNQKVLSRWQLSAATWGQQRGLRSLLRCCRRFPLLWQMKASSCLLIRSSVLRRSHVHCTLSSAAGVWNPQRWRFSSYQRALQVHVGSGRRSAAFEHTWKASVQFDGVRGMLGKSAETQTADYFMLWLSSHHVVVERQPSSNIPGF